MKNTTHCFKPIFFVHKFKLRAQKSRKKWTKNSDESYEEIIVEEKLKNSVAEISKNSPKKWRKKSREFFGQILDFGQENSNIS